MTAGRHAVVSGGGTGLGAAIAKSLLQAGARVTVLGRRVAPLEAVVAGDPQGQAIAADVTDRPGLEAALGGAVKMFGPPEIVVANAGAADSAPFEKIDQAHWDDMLAVNLTGVFNLFQATLPALRQAGWGRMVAVASVAGLKGYPYVAPYCAAKHGVIGLVRALAAETAKAGVTVNAVCPGYSETPMLDDAIANISQTTGRSPDEARQALARLNPQGRFIQPEEVADAVLWLCGDHAASVTGQALSLSGGEITP